MRGTKDDTPWLDGRTCFCLRLAGRGTRYTLRLRYAWLARWHGEYAESDRERSCRPGPAAARRDPGEAMEVGGGTGGVPAGYALGEQPADHTGQDISGPSSGHPRVSGRTDRGHPSGLAITVRAPLRMTNTPRSRANRRGRAEAVVIDGLRGRLSFQPGHFSGWG